MELIEIENSFDMDGAPAPLIISTDNNLYLSFYAGVQKTHLHERNMVADKGIFVLEFNQFVSYKFGMPNNETIQGHPYYQLGLKPYSFYQLKGSDWLEELAQIDSVHPYSKAEKWKELKHYILTFHDNMFECIAMSFEIEQKNISTCDQAYSILTELFGKKFN